METECVEYSPCAVRHSNRDTEQRLLLVLDRPSTQGVRPTRVFQFNTFFAATDQSNVTEVPAAVSGKRVDVPLRTVALRIDPLSPDVNTIGHRVGNLDVHDSRPLPMILPPGSGVQPPTVLRPLSPIADLIDLQLAECQNNAVMTDARRDARVVKRNSREN